jgi:hypothetical protein
MKEQVAAVHLLVSRHFENKNDTAPQGHNLESDQANRTDFADRGTCDLAIFGTLLCPGGGRILYGWIPQNSSFGFLDIAGAKLGQIHF